MYSFTEENYLKAIFKLSSGPGMEEVNTNALAEELQTRAASVTDMLKKLADKSLVHYEKYKGVSLTKQGRQVAVNVVRKHRLWEVFLYNQLGFGWDEVHEIAEQLEHIQSDELINRLDAFLEFPKHDPHGDPIPDKEERFIQDSYTDLSKGNKATWYVLTGVTDHSSSFLKMLEKWGVTLGSELQIVDINEFDGSMELEKRDGKTIFLGNKSAGNIMVKVVK